MSVAACESTMNPAAISPSGQHIGLFQVSLVHGYSVDYLLVPENNVAVAYQLYLDRGWQPWTCGPGG